MPRLSRPAPPAGTLTAPRHAPCDRPRPGRSLTLLRLAGASRCRLHRRYRRPGSSFQSPEASLLRPEGLGWLARPFPFFGA